MNVFRNRKGASLIEILATLAILTIGILAVARMFSGGYVVLRRSENATFAARLAEKEFERLDGRSDTLPLGITTASGVAPDFLPGPPITDDNRTKINEIIGETVKIPGPNLASGTSGALVGSVYDLTFTPVASIDAVYSAPMRRRVMDSTDPNVQPYYSLPLTQYAIDYDNAMIAFRSVAPGRIFTITYSYWVTTKQGQTSQTLLHTATSVNIYVPGNTTGWIPIPADTGGSLGSVSGFAGIDEGSDQVARGFTNIAVSDAWSPTDPYQYKVLDGLLGRIAFNPLGYAYKERTPQGIQDLTAHIDYQVYDWGIISEDLQVPDSSPYTVRTTLKNIEQTGIDINPDGSLYGGVAPGTSLGNADVVIVDEETGNLEPVGGATGATVDYQKGIITFPDALGATLAGRQLRVYYRALGDWQVQVQKAYEEYTPQGSRATVSYRQYFNDPTSPNPNRMYFTALDASKSFSVDYAWVDSGGTHTVIGEVDQAADGLDGSNAYVDLTHTPSAIIAVRGISLKVRVLWSEGTTVDLTTNQIVPRWEYYDLDGDLTRTLSLG